MTVGRVTKIVAASMALLLMPLAAAAAEDDDERDEQREYEIQVSASEARIQMASEDADNEREVYFEYKRDDAAVEFGYETETAAQESEASMEIQFHQLFEYEDANGNGKYDLGEAIVSGFDLGAGGEESLFAEADRATWNPIQSSAVTSDNGVPGTKFSSIANVGSGQLRFDFYVFGDAASLGDATIASTEIKLDIIIENYAFQSETSALALLLESEAESEIEVDDEVDSDEEGVVSMAGRDQLLFAWKDFATVDGAKKDVLTTKLESEESQNAQEYESEELIVFSYARGDEIVHDPTLGVASASSANVVPGPAISLAVAAVATLAIWRRKSVAE